MFEQTDRRTERTEEDIQRLKAFDELTYWHGDNLKNPVASVDSGSLTDEG